MQVRLTTQRKSLVEPSVRLLPSPFGSFVTTTATQMTTPIVKDEMKDL